VTTVEVTNPILHLYYVKNEDGKWPIV